MTGPIESPCVKVCVIDGNEMCQGCFRTMAEIAAWRDASDHEKAAVLLNVQARQTAVFEVTATSAQSCKLIPITLITPN